MSGNYSDDSAGPPIPRGVLKSRGGWQGEEMELEHTRDGASKERTSAAVDLKQFRNEEVGKGYQAKQVIRQRSGQESEVKFQDMSRANESQKKEKRKRDDERPGKNDDQPKERLKRYLQSNGLRSFRKELEKIVSSA